MKYRNSITMIVFRHIYVLLTVILFAFSSCEDERYDNTYRVPATFTPFTKGNDEASITSRASGTSWTSGDQVGIYMVTSGSSLAATNLANNVPYKASLMGPDASLIPVENTIYYPIDGSKVNFVAYYPYQSSITTTNVYAVDIATQTTPANIDLLYHKGTTGYSRYNAAASLEFKHQLSKIVINVTRGTNVTTDLSGLTSTITGIPRTANFALSTGTISGLGSKEIITLLKNTNSTSATKSVQEAIIVPHAVGTSYKNRTMTFTVGGTAYNYPISDSQVFESGYVYTYNLKLSTSGVVLSETTISDWNAGTAAWDGKYALTTDVNTMAFEAAASTQNITIKVKTSTTVPIAEKSTSSTSVTGLASWLSLGTIPAGTKSGDWITYTLPVTATENTSTIIARGPAYVHLSVEGLSVVIMVNQSKKKTITTDRTMYFTAADQTASMYIYLNYTTDTNPLITYSLDGNNAISCPEWLKVDPKVARTQVGLNCSVTENPSWNTTRTVYIHVTWDGLEHKTLLTQDKYGAQNIITIEPEYERNCYMVPPNSVLRFPCQRAFDYGDYDEPTILGVKTLWDTSAHWSPGAGVIGTPKFVFGADGTRYVEVATTNNTGSALVFVTDERRLGWSYHIWVTEFDDTRDVVLLPTGSVVMIPFLGSSILDTDDGIDNGLFYQYGRKDPFFGQPSATMTATADERSLRMNPTVYVKNWSVELAHSAHGNNPWYGGDMLYDPCPIGWRTPDDLEFRGITGLTEEGYDWFFWDLEWPYGTGMEWRTPGIINGSGLYRYANGDDGDDYRKAFFAGYEGKPYCLMLTTWDGGLDYLEWDMVSDMVVGMNIRCIRD